MLERQRGSCHPYQDARRIKRTANDDLGPSSAPSLAPWVLGIPASQPVDGAPLRVQAPQPRCRQMEGDPLHPQVLSIDDACPQPGGNGCEVTGDT